MIKKTGDSSGLSDEGKVLQRELECARLFASTLDLRQLTANFLKIVHAETPFARGTVFYVDHKQQILRSLIAQDVQDVEITVPIGAGMAGYVAMTGTPLDVPKASFDDRFLGAFDQKLGFKTEDAYCLPLFDSQNACIGVLQLLNRQRPLTDDDVHWLGYMATELGKALQNAWAHHQLKEEHEQQKDLIQGLQESVDQLRHFAIHDALTGLKNLRYLQDALEVELERAKRLHHPLSLILLDVDHFKRINDTYGHQCGDLVLQQLANRIQGTCRKYDVAARYGGEEFAILLPQTDLVAASAKAERCRNSIERLEIQMEGNTISITTSLGVAVYEASSPVSRARLIHLADRALYASKRGGRNRITVATSYPTAE